MKSRGVGHSHVWDDRCARLAAFGAVGEMEDAPVGRVEEELMEVGLVDTGVAFVRNGERLSGRVQVREVTGRPGGAQLKAS
jgi:hypothetical protein